MTYTFDSDQVSDLHKDAYGYRPGSWWWDMWDHLSMEGKQMEWDSILKALARENERFELEQKHAIEKFEGLVTRTIDNGAEDRQSAIEWIMHCSDCDDDWDFLCYMHGLPFNYFNSVEC